jgi:DNA polymerase
VSADDLRKEAASIAHSAKRLIERERARGGGDLLAAGVAKARASARAKGIVLPPPPTPIAQPVTSEAAPAVAQVAAPEAPIAAAPIAPAATGDMPDFIANSPAFKPPAPQPEPKVAPDFVLPPFTEQLYPSAIGGHRDAIVAASLPVLADVAAQANACEKCELCKTRTKAVPGVGSARSGIVFVGEAPGADEDLRGEPFVGRAGELLTKMIEGMHQRALIPGVKLDRDEVYIVNVLKCRPPDNRNPLPHEIEACSPYVMRQLEALQPRVICCLGKFAAELLLGMKGTISSMRGKTYRWKGAKLIVTYHPAYCLRSPSAKRPVWDDLQRLAQEYLTD